jgi:hypothetical protein
MNSTEENRFRPLYEKMQQFLVLQGLRPKTVVAYSRAIRRLAGDLRQISNAQRPMDRGGVQSAIKAAVADSDISRKITMHSLRHSFATHTSCCRTRVAIAAADAWCAPGGPRSGVVETVPSSTTGSVSQPSLGGAVPKIPPFHPFCAVPSLTTPNPA